MGASLRKSSLENARVVHPFNVSSFKSPSKRGSVSSNGTRETRLSSVDSSMMMIATADFPVNRQLPMNMDDPQSRSRSSRRFSLYQTPQRFDLGLRRRSVRSREANSLVAHFSPPSFPINPVFTPNTCNVLEKSWNHIEKGQRSAGGQSLLINFFDLFFARLYIKSSVCKEFFMELSFKKKSKMLTQFIRLVQESVAQSSPMDLRNLSRLSSSVSLFIDCGVPLSLVSVFSETLVETIAHFSIDDEEKETVKEAWAHATARTLSFLLHEMVMQREGMDNDLATMNVTVGECTITGNVCCCSKNGGGEGSNDSAQQKQHNWLSSVLRRSKDRKTSVTIPLNLMMSQSSSSTTTHR